MEKEKCREHRVNLFLGGLFLASFLPFMNTLWNHFVYDDLQYIVRNPLLNEPFSLGGIFLNSFPPDSPAQGLYRPLVTLSLLIDHFFFGLNPVGYHLQNILWHGGVTIAVFFLLARVSSSLLPPLLGALLFAVHPVHTEAVSWAVGRAELMAAFFSLLAFLLFMDNRGWGLSPALLFLLGLFSKEMAASLPFLLLLFEGIYRGRKGIQWKKYIPLAAVLAIFLVLRVLALEGLGPRGKHQVFFNQGLWARAASIPLVLCTYLKLLFLPLNLNVRYDYSREQTLLGTKGLLLLLILLTLLFLAFRCRKKCPVLSFSLGWFFLSLLPVLNLIPIGEVIAERFLYLPSVSLALFLTLVLEWGNGKKRHYGIRQVPAVLVLALFSLLSLQRNLVWRESYSLWSDSVGKSAGNPYAHFGLGYALLSKGLRAGQGDRTAFFEKAVLSFQRVLEFDASFPKASHVFYNLGYLRVLLEGRSEVSAAYFRSALELDLSYTGAMVNLIDHWLYPSTGVRAEEVLSLCRKGLTLSKDLRQREYFMKMEEKARRALQEEKSR